MAPFHKRDNQPALNNRPSPELSFPTLFWLFVAGSLLGFVLEGCWHFLHHGTWGFRVATLWGPFCIIYGAGAVVMYLIALAIRKHSPATQFLIFALAGSTVEYLSGLFQEAMFGTVSWDYSHHAFNLRGRISLRMTILWGIAGMALMYCILPLLLSCFSHLNLQQHTFLCKTAAIFMCINLLLTSAALMRWHERTIHASPADNAVEEYLDARWPDEKMQNRFPNMVFVR